MQNYNNIKEGDMLVANMSLYSPYNCKRICTAGHTYPVISVERAMGSVHRITIDTSDDSSVDHRYYSILGDSINFMREFSADARSYTRADGYTVSVDIRSSSTTPNISISRRKDGVRISEGDSFMVNCDQRFIALMRRVFAEVEARGCK